MLRCLAILLAILLAGPLSVAPVLAQDQGAAAPEPRVQGPAPAMENVFFNVVYGSGIGALLGLAAAIESSPDKTQPQNTHNSTFEGATIGGLLGLGLGLWLLYAGITFDPHGAIVQVDPAPLNQSVAYQPKDLVPGPGDAQIQFVPPTVSALPPFAFETAPGQPGHITGFRARVMDLRF